MGQRQVQKMISPATLDFLMACAIAIIALVYIMRRK